MKKRVGDEIYTIDTMSNVEALKREYKGYHLRSMKRMGTMKHPFHNVSQFYVFTFVKTSL